MLKQDTKDAELKVKTGNFPKKLQFLGEFIFFTQSSARVQFKHLLILFLDYSLISTFTPLGRSSFIKASTVF